MPQDCITYPEKIEKIYKDCKKSDFIYNTVQSGLEKLKEIIEDKYASDENKLYAKNVKTSLMVGLCYAECKRSNFEGENVERSTSIIQKLIDNEKKLEIPNETVLKQTEKELVALNESVAFMNSIRGVLLTAGSDAMALIEGKRQVERLIAERLKTYPNSDDYCDVIAKKEIALAEKQIKEKFNNSFPGLYDSLFREIDFSKYKYCKIFSALLDNDIFQNSVLVLLSPYEEEIIFNAYRQADFISKKLVVIETEVFESASEDGFSFCLSQLINDLKSINQNAIILFVGLDKVNAKTRKEKLGKRIARLSKEFLGQIYIADTKGNNNFVELIKNKEGENIARARELVLAMPEIEDVENLLSIQFGGANDEERQIFLQENRDYIKSVMCNLGYLGLNKVLIASNRWKNIAEKLNKQELLTFKKFAEDLDGNGYLISDKWLTDVNKKRKTSTFYDYDIRFDFSDEVLDNILSNANLSIKAKIGHAVTYCLGCGNDDSNYANDIDTDERLVRITNAASVIARYLGLKKVPRIEFSKGTLGKNASLIGLCCEGGALIKLKASYCEKSLQNTKEVLLHEMYHSMQHIAVYEPYMGMLGVTKNRYKDWQENFNCYIDCGGNYYNYYLQLVEADAEIFVADVVLEEYSSISVVKYN